MSDAGFDVEICTKKPMVAIKSNSICDVYSICAQHQFHNNGYAL